MAAKGTVTAHKMFEKGDPGSGWGSNEGRIASFPMTFSNCKTEDGKITIYFSEGEFTGEDIEIRDNGYYDKDGIVLTIDKDIQLIAEKAFKKGRLLQFAKILS